MKSAEFRIFGKTAVSVVLSALLLSGPTAFSAGRSRSSDNGDIGRSRSIAESGHEMVMIYLDKKDYEKAAEEANKIFAMSWPDSEEPLLLKELLILSDQFLQRGQANLALRIINNNSRRFKQTSSQAQILKESGYLYKSLNQNDRALDCFRRAQELEQQR